MNRMFFFFFCTALLLGCKKTWYINETGEVRPLNPEFLIKPNIEDIKILDTVPFVIKEVYAFHFADEDQPVVEFITVFSTDGRVASYVDSSKFIGDKLVILPNLWHESPSVGFYSEKGDTIYLEYYLHKGFGEYIEKHCYKTSSDLVVFKVLVGKKKRKYNVKPIPSIYRKVNWIQL